MRQLARVAVAVALVACWLPARPEAQPAGPATRQSPHPVTPSLQGAFTLLEQYDHAAAHEQFTAILAGTNLASSHRARALRGLGIAQFRLKLRDEAARSLELAIETAAAAGDLTERAWARRWLGVLRYDDGRAEQARELWSAARDEFLLAGEARGEFQATEDLAQLAHGLSTRPLVERCYAIALDLRDPVLEARARRRWARTLLFAAKPGAALVELERAVSLLRAAGPGAEHYLADTLSTMGWALRSHGANDRSVRVHQEALRLARAHRDLNAQVWNNQGLAIALTGLGRYAEAEAAMHRGLAAAQAQGGVTPVRILTESLAWVVLRQGRWADAARALESSMAMPGLEVAVTPVINLARAYRHLGRFDDARRQAERAVELARAQGLVDNELRALIELAVVHEQRGNLAAAGHAIGEVVDRLEVYRTELAPQDFLKQGFGDSFADAYGIAVRIRMLCGELAGALTAAERLRSRAFADLLASRRQRDSDVADVERGVWNLGATTAPSPAPPPAQVDSRQAVPALDALALAALAARFDTTLVAYWIHEEGSYAWVVRPTGAIHATKLMMGPAEVQRLVGRVADSSPDVEIAHTSTTSASASVKDRSAYRSAYQQFWAPIEGWLPASADARLTIIPHGALFALPFGALLDANGRYVIERYSLHYAASGAVLAEAIGPRRAAAGTRHLLVADPRPLPPGPTGVSLPPLAGARAEARTIATMLGTDAELLVGRGATESAVRDAIAGARVLHFATHAIVSDADPLGSHLLLAPAPGERPSSERDGRLTGGEVAGLTVAADLVVLGACRSARGRVSSDGIAGLTRAFMAAGAPSVIATLWDVSDETTATVMTRFFAAFTQGGSKDRALRAAQLRLLRELRAGRVRAKVGATTVTFPEHPQLWAGAVLIGAP